MRRLREDGSAIEPNDPFWEALNIAAKAAKTNPRTPLAQPNIYGDLVDNQRFATAFTHWLRMIWSQGTEAALRSYTGQA